MKRFMLAASVLGLMFWTSSIAIAGLAGDQPTTSTTVTKKSSKKTSTTASTTTAPSGNATTAATTKKGPQPTPTATPAQIAAAKTAGQVWVNTASGVWHTSSSKWYGATKQGKFMSEAEATKAGYHAAKGGE